MSRLRGVNLYVGYWFPVKCKFDQTEGLNVLTSHFFYRLLLLIVNERLLCVHLLMYTIISIQVT